MRAPRAAAVAALLLFANSVAAAPTSDAKPSAEAQALFVEAVDALNTGRFAEARDLLLRSLELAPNAGSAFNLAVAYRGTGQPMEADDVFKRLLKEEFGQLSSAQKKEIRQLRRDVRSEIATLSIQAKGADRITVRVDGQQVATLADSELFEWQLNPGSHQVSLSAPLRVTVDRRVLLERGEGATVFEKLELTDEAKVGVVVVEATRAGDVVKIVGVGHGVGSIRHRLPPGTYEVEVSGDAGTRRSTVEVKAGQTVRLQLDSDQGGAWYGNPWLWTGVGVVAVGAVSAFVMLRDPVDDPVRDPVWDVTTTRIVW